MPIKDVLLKNVPSENDKIGTAQNSNASLMNENALEGVVEPELTEIEDLIN